MQIAFENLVESFIDNNVGIAENFLNVELASQLRKNLLALNVQEKLLLAGTGNNTALKFNEKIRSDKVFWLDKSHNDAHENAFFVLLDSFIKYLNRTCYTGIKNYEFHYALYEPGTFYKKHRDQFKTDSSRAFSMILYLNDAWQPGDGGELQIYHPDFLETIAPKNGKCVFFRSNEFEHEVLVTNKQRMSITGWLKT